LFAPKYHGPIQEAIIDYSHLLTRGYGNSALELVGNRYKLNKRQRIAVGRMTASSQAIVARQNNHIPKSQLAGSIVEIDGFNLLILLESTLSGAYVFKCQDGCYRDVSSVHGTYKRVVKTEEAVLLVGQTLERLGVKQVNWFFDSPVSNSGRLKSMLLELARVHGFPWSVELVYNPDTVLVKSPEIVVSSDAWILDHCAQWFNLGALLVAEIGGESVLDLVGTRD